MGYAGRLKLFDGACPTGLLLTIYLGIGQIAAWLVWVAGNFSAFEANTYLRRPAQPQRNGPPYGCRMHENLMPQSQKSGFIGQPR